jgi:hypothetical protein
LEEGNGSPYGNIQINREICDRRKVYVNRPNSKIFEIRSSKYCEAWRKRRYPAAFISKLNDAEGGSAETQTHLEIAKRCGYIDRESASGLDSLYEETMAMLVSMIAHPDQWVIRRPNKVNRKES